MFNLNFVRRRASVGVDINVCRDARGEKSFFAELELPRSMPDARRTC